MILGEVILNGLPHLICYYIHSFLVDVVILEGDGVYEELPLVVIVLPDVVFLLKDHQKYLEALIEGVVGEGILEDLFLVERETSAKHEVEAGQGHLVALLDLLDDLEPDVWDDLFDKGSSLFGALEGDWLGIGTS